MENIKGFILPITAPNVIDSFRDFFLSNFYIKSLYYKGEWYKSAEHAFQAEKAVNGKDKQYIMNAPTAAQAKHRSNEITCRKDWHEKRMIIMLNILRCKFTVLDGLDDKLIATENFLIEGNSWGDNFWGMVRDINTGEWKGDNFLGKFLMKVRNEIR